MYLLLRMQCVISNTSNIHCSQCQIFIGQGGHIDTSGHEPDSSYDTALRILQVQQALQTRLTIG
jgi:hypothetical protein